MPVRRRHPLPTALIRHFGIDRAIDSADYPGSTTLPPLQSVLAQDPDADLLLRADSGIRRQSAADSVLEFLDFFRRHGPAVRFLAFDSRFTTSAQLARLDQDGILFVTVRRRGKRLLEQQRMLGHIEVNREHASMAWLALQRQSSPHSLDRAARQRQTQPRPGDC